MAKISLWKPEQGKDYNYIDRIAREYVDLSGTGVYVHKYIGPVIGEGDDNKSNVGDGITTDELTIGDVLFLENRARKYDPDIIELRGSYTVSDTDFDLSQFGIFLTDDTIFMTFHLNDNVDRLGRKLMAGDVLDLPHLRDYFPLDDEKAAINRFYVVEDATPSAEGYGPRWWSHLWRVRAKMMPASTEYQDILDRVAGDGQSLESLPPSGDGDDCCEETVGDVITGGGKEDINDAIEEQAARDVPYDPLHYDAAHFWVCIDPITEEHELIYWKSGDGAPPNGIALAGSGDTFPETLVENDYFLRTDFQPRPVLYQKRGNKYYKIEVDQRKLPWTAANQLLDTFIDNTNTMTNDEGNVLDEKVALSKAVRARPRAGESQQIPTTDAPDLNGDDANLFGPEFGDEFD
jgi:hypothetical protein